MNKKSRASKTKREKKKKTPAKAAVRKLKTKKLLFKGKPTKAKQKQKVASSRTTIAKARKKARSKRREIKPKPVPKRTTGKIVRIMGHGQFRVDDKTLKRLNEIDNAIVEFVSMDGSGDDIEFKKKLAQLEEIVMSNGKSLDAKEIVPSDIILPAADLSVDEARKIFRGEGVIPEIYA